MLRRQILIGTVLVLATVLFHVACIVGLVDILAWAEQVIESSGLIKTLLIFGLAVTCILVIHGIEAWFWAFIYMRLGQFEDIATAVYFSVVTTTTLGYGDYTMSARWRVLASFQAIGGLILFGASTAFLFEIIRRLFPDA